MAKRKNVVKELFAKGEERVTEVREQFAKGAEDLKDRMNTAVETGRNRGQEIFDKINIGKAVDLETLKGRLENLETDLESLLSDLTDRIGELNRRVADLRGAKVVVEMAANDRSEASEDAIPATATEETAADLAENTVAALRQIAAERGIQAPRKLRKAELINLILANN